ncbi:MAG: hypothetical protein DWQ19_09230 [Crenarchaeota archaeon]|nr:MAG: hypothetical protein DWQ19_09230 [Thermoproteota archaeon]
MNYYRVVIIKRSVGYFLPFGPDTTIVAGSDLGTAAELLEGCPDMLSLEDAKDMAKDYNKAELNNPNGTWAIVRPVVEMN